MKPVSVLSFLRRCGSQTDCNYFLPGTGSVWRTKCTQNTLVTIRLVRTKYAPHARPRTHTHTHRQTSTHNHKRTGTFPQTHAHIHKNKLQMNTDTKQAQLFLLVVLSCCDYSQRESDLLINATNAVCFPAVFKKCCLHGIYAITCCSAFINNCTTTLAHIESYARTHTHTYCTETRHLTITQHTAGFFLLFAGSKLDVPYIFSYADGHITGAGIPLK